MLHAHAAREENTNGAMALNPTDPNTVFERPVFIVAAPRSGSSFLFETLSQCAALWTIGDESHAVIESIASLVPGAPGVDSNRLTAKQADPATAYQLRLKFLQQLRDRNGTPVASRGLQQLRMLEKTPKNALRIPFLKAVFPGAIFIYLYRDARENISSIIDAWKAGSWVTYPNLPGWNGKWSLLLPPGWQDMKGRSHSELAAFQWKAANQAILDDLCEIEGDRWTTVNYRELVTNPEKQVRRLCKLAGVKVDKLFAQYLRGNLPLSKYTLAPPSQDKWKKNESEIAGILPVLDSLVQRIEKVARNKEMSVSRSQGVIEDRRIGRNDPCPCGSGKKFKRCHGVAN